MIKGCGSIYIYIYIHIYIVKHLWGKFGANVMKSNLFTIVLSQLFWVVMQQFSAFAGQSKEQL